MSEKVTRDGKPIAGWILKANPDVFDAGSALERHGVITGWTLKQTYRVDLMKPGDRCFLYLTAGKRHPADPGLIASGVVTAETEMGQGSGGPLWLDQKRAQSVVPVASVELLALADRVPKADLKADPVLAEMELFRSPQMSNPVVVRPDELVALEALGLEVVEPTDEQLARLAEDEGDVDELPAG